MAGSRQWEPATPAAGQRWPASWGRLSSEGLAGPRWVDCETKTSTLQSFRHFGALLGEALFAAAFFAGVFFAEAFFAGLFFADAFFAATLMDG